MTLLESRRVGDMFPNPYKGSSNVLEGLLGSTSPQPSTQQETLSESDFFMFCFKIQPCPIKSTHPWERCCYAHPHENARRRDPRQYRYIAEPCPDYKRGICLLGVQCPYAHGVYERNLHPSKYRTQLCTEGNHCSRHVCFFAHSPFQLRAPTHLWSIEEAEYVRQILLEKIIRESEQAALREQAASLLAASQPVAARAGQGGFLGGGRYGAPAQQPASGMKAFHQQHLQNQMLQGLAKQSSPQAEERTMNPQSNVHSPFAQMQLGSPPSTLQVPATPPGINPAPLRNTSVSPMRQDSSPDSRRRAAGLTLRQAMSQPTPGQDDPLAEAAMRAQGALNQATGLPALGPTPLRMHRSGRALTEDAEGPRMSMAMRRQLGMAPNKSPSKAGSAAALLSAGGNPLRQHSPVMSPSQSATLPFPAMGGMLSQQEAVSQGLLLQQAAMALQMQGASTLYGGELPPDASTQALHAHLRQQHYGTSNASEISQPTDDYAELVNRLQGMCFGLLEDQTGLGMVDGGAHNEEVRTASTGSGGRFDSAGSAHAFDLDLGPLTSQPQGPHATGHAFSAPPGTTHQDPANSSHSFFSY